MKFVVIEIQKLSDGSIAVPPVSTFSTFNEAVSRYHSIMSVASVSDVPVHSCVVLNEEGQTLRLESINHEEQPTTPEA